MSNTTAKPMSASDLRRIPYDAFNKGAKRTLRSMREKFPEVATSFGVLLVLLKLTKHMGRKMPQRFFVELLQRPYADRMAARDSEFFMSDAFVVVGHEDAVRDVKKQLRMLSGEEREDLWKVMLDLIELSNRCGGGGDAS